MSRNMTLWSRRRSALDRHKSIACVPADPTPIGVCDDRATANFIGHPQTDAERTRNQRMAKSPPCESPIHGEPGHTIGRKGSCGSFDLMLVPINPSSALWRTSSTAQLPVLQFRAKFRAFASWRQELSCLVRVCKQHHTFLRRPSPFYGEYL